MRALHPSITIAVIASLLTACGDVGPDQPTDDEPASIDAGLVDAEPPEVVLVDARPDCMAGPEVPNDLDDDCDGAIDEGWAVGDDMQPGEVLAPGRSLSSPSGRFTFVYQGDGNLVLYRNQDGVALWSSGTAGSSVGTCVMQGDGNLVVYDAAGVPVWNAGTWTHPGSRLAIQNDGAAVIYRPDDTPVWTSYW